MVGWWWQCWLTFMVTVGRQTLHLICCPCSILQLVPRQGNLIYQMMTRCLDTRRHADWLEMLMPGCTWHNIMTLPCHTSSPPLPTHTGLMIAVSVHLLLVCCLLFALPVDLTVVGIGRPNFGFGAECGLWINGHFRWTFGFGRKQSYHIRCTFGFGRLQLVNSVVAKSRSQSLSCGDQSTPDAGSH